ncbi:MAG: hypothetical protein OET18_08385, partial [Desulfobacterales bacterium]|nr:hypothetical protein [Desulfobacterales bacterium]
MTVIQNVNNGDLGLDARNKINSNANNLNADKLEQVDLTQKQVGFGSALNLLTGSAQFIWDDTNKSLAAGDTVAATGLNAVAFGENNTASEEGAAVFGGSN